MKIIGVLLFTLFLCVGCQGTVTRALRHDGFSIGNDFACDVVFPAKKDDTSYGKIKYLTNNFFVTEEGKIYELSLQQVYANNQHCMEASTDVVVQSILDNQYFKATNGNYYYLAAQNGIEKYSVVPETDKNYNLMNLLLQDNEVVKVMTADSSTGLYYVLKTDGNIYGYVVTTADRNSPPVVTAIQVVYSKDDYGGDIIDFNFSGNNSLSTFVKTKDKVFRLRVTNSEECSKYVDITCEFAMSEDTVFEEYKDSIIAFSGSYLITSYKKIFSVAS